MIVGNFNIPLKPVDRSSKQKISKETSALKYILDQMNLNVIYRTLYPEAMKYTFFSNAYGIFFKIDHMLGHKLVLINLRGLKY